MKKSYLSAYFPRWSVNIVEKSSPRSSLGKGVLLIANQGNQPFIKRMCALSERMGVREGSTLPLAKAFLPSAIVTEFNPKEDFRKLYKLGAWTIKFTPIVALDRELVSAYRSHSLDKVSPLYYGIFLDLTGTERLHKGFDTLARSLYTKLQGARLEASIAIAPTIGAAWAFSRFQAENVRLYGDDYCQALNSLPVKALRLNTETVESLKQVGLRRIQDLSTISSKALAERFGKSIVKKLQQARGEAFETLTLLQPPLSWTVKKEFSVPPRVVRGAALARCYSKKYKSGIRMPRLFSENWNLARSP